MGVDFVIILSQEQQTRLIMMRSYFTVVLLGLKSSSELRIEDDNVGQIEFFFFIF